MNDSAFDVSDYEDFDDYYDFIENYNRDREGDVYKFSEQIKILQKT